MIIGDEVKKKISDTPDGVVLTISDFNVDMQYQGALVKAAGVGEMNLRYQ